MKKPKIKDKRLEKYVGKTFVVVHKDHPFYHCVGVGKDFEETDLGFALLSEYEGGETAYIFSAAEVIVINDEKAPMSTEAIIELLAGCNYSPKQIAEYLELPEAEFMAAWNDKKSNIRFHYEKGRLSADFDVNQKLLENARTGNITAAQMFFKNSEARKFEDLKARLFYGS